MKTSEFTTRPSSETINSWPAADSLKVAAIYEEFAAGIRLKEALISLGRSLGIVRVIHQAWSFSMLERLDVRAAAVREAADADILIVVATGDQALPVQIIRWLERCLMERGRGPAALVELHDDVYDQEDSPIPLSTEMGGIAGRWQRDLITNRQFDEWLDADNLQQIIRQPDPSFEFSNS